MDNPEILTSAATVTWVFVGIIISLALPVAIRTLKVQGGVEGARSATKPTIGQRIAKAWKDYGGNKYLAIAVSAAVVAIVIVFLLGLEFYTVRDAAIAGFAWESLINKVMTQKSSTG